MPLKKPSEFYIKNPSTSMDEVKELKNEGIETEMIPWIEEKEN